MQQAQGYIQKIGQKQGMGKNGPYTAYSMNVDGQWYNCGFKPIPAQEGDYVTFTLVQKGQYTNAQNIQPSAGQQQAAPQRNIPQPSSAPTALPVNKKDVSIHYQSCRKDAINMFSVLLDKEAIKLPAKQSDKYDAALALVKELTVQFYTELEGVIENGGVEAEDLVPDANGGE